MTTNELNRLAGQIDAILAAAPRGGLTISQVARKARCDYFDARDCLDSLVSLGYATTSGNGAWTHYHSK